MKLFLSICAAFALCVCSGVWQLRSQTTSNLSATVQFDDGNVVTITDFSNQVGVQPGEAITVTAQFPAAGAGGKPVIVDLPDGGWNSVGSSLPVADAQGVITFTVIANTQPGQNRVNIRIGLTTVCLQLWVMDSQNPQNNPPNLVAVSQG